MRRFSVSFSTGTPCKGVYCNSLRARGPCPLLTWPTLKTIRGTSRDQTAGCLTTGCWAVRLQVWHLWLLLETSLILRHAIIWGLCVFTLTVPHEFGNPVLRTGTYVSLKLHSWLLTNENSVRPSSNTVNCPIISAALLAVLFTDQLFISIYQTQMKVEHAKRLLNFSISYGKIVTSDCSQYLPIFIQCGRIYASCLSFFSNHRSVMDQKLNWNVRLALEPRSYLHFIIYRQLALSPFLY